jgi:PelA/Pel-15E family pectate lyase
MNNQLHITSLIILLSGVCNISFAADEDLRTDVVAAMHKAAVFYRTKVASHGGYVYFYSLDFKDRWGEGVASRDQIWVQPPGTPTVGMAYVKAYESTGERFYLDAATAAANALVYGQLQSGGWTNCVDFNPKGKRVAQYLNGKGRGKNNSSLDDGQSQSAIRLLIHIDRANGFKHKTIHQAAKIALEALLKAQYPNGAFPQVWTGPVPRQPVLKASFPRYDWRTEGRIKNYWDMYTLNDSIAGYVSETLLDAYTIYKNEKYKSALTRLGDFLILAQMPKPQPAWAQQYSYEMHPIWARRFEPPGVSGGESQDVIETLMKIYRFSGDRKYLEPIPRAIAYLKRSLLPDGRLSRYYALKTNRPLYMNRNGKNYSLTYDDSNLPRHYGWKITSRLDALEKEYHKLIRGTPALSTATPERDDLEPRVREILKNLDSQGRWISTYTGERLVGQPKFKPNSRYISSEVFSRNIETLSAFLIATQQ